VSDETLTVREAIPMYLSDRMDLRERTKNSHRYRLKQFRLWCESEGIETVDELSGRDLAEFRHHRVEEQDVAPMTVRGNSYTLRNFLRFCEDLGAVEEGLAAKVRIPSLSQEDITRVHDLDPERVADLLEHMDEFRYASRDHVVLLLMFHTGCRVGALHALDLDDFHREGRFLEFVHRPPSTALKNGKKGERPRSRRG